MATVALGLATVLATVVVTAALLAWRPLLAQPQHGSASTAAAPPATTQVQARCEPLDSLINVSLSPLVDDPCSLGTFSDLTIDTHGRVFQLTPLTDTERKAESLAAQLALGDAAIADFLGGGRFAVAAFIDDRGDEKYLVPSTGSRYVNVGVTRYSDGQTWVAAVDTAKQKVLSVKPFMSSNPIWPAEDSSLHPEVAPLNPVEILLAFAVGEKDPQVGAEVSRTATERYRADVIYFGYGPLACTDKRCAVAAWSGGPVVTVDLTNLSVVAWRPARAQWW